MEPPGTEGRRRSVGMEPPWKSFESHRVSTPFLHRHFPLSLFLSVYMETCIYIVVLDMVYYWILLGGNGIGAIIFASANCTFPPFLATHCRPILGHDIHNQKPTYHRKATNFRAWDPLSKTKSQHKFTGYKITNTNSDRLRSTDTNPHFLINAFRILDHNHNSQPIHHQDL